MHTYKLTDNHSAEYTSEEHVKANYIKLMDLGRDVFYLRELVNELRSKVSTLESPETPQQSGSFNNLLPRGDTRGTRGTRDTRGDTRGGTHGGGTPSVRRHADWVSAGRKATLKDGSTRTLYMNVSKPGELRIRRMTTRDGKSVATYVKPPK